MRVERALFISVRYTDENKRVQIKWLTVFKHEFDHLDGKLIY